MGFWQARFEVLGSLQAQLDTPQARSIIALLRASSTDRNLLASFQSHFGELSRVSSISARLTAVATTEFNRLKQSCTQLRVHATASIHFICCAWRACSIAGPGGGLHSA